MHATIFKNLFEQNQKPHYSSVAKILETIKTGPKQLDLINQIRNSKDKEERDAVKRQLTVILFGGKFSERRADALLEYSRLIVLDFDKCNVRTKRQELTLLPWIYALWLSPGGDGLKALVRVSSDNHGGHFKALEKELPGLDVSGKDVSRACFMSYDPTLYLNESSALYTKIVESVYSDEQKLEKLKLWLKNKGEAFVEGNRNNFLAKLAGACNRFGLTQDFVTKIFEKDYATGTDFSVSEARQVVKSIYTNYSDVHATASFNESFGEERVADILSAQITTRDIITANDVKADLIKDFEEGTKGGTTTYFPGLDAHFRWMRGELTVLTGVASAGKSAVLQQLLLFKSVFEKQKFGLLSLEQYPPIFFYREMIRSLIGKPIEKAHPNRMSMAEYKRGLEWVNEHFFFVYPEKDAASPDWTLARFAEAQIKHGLQGVVIDPHNSQSHEKMGSQARDLYLGEMLRKYQRHSVQNNLYFIDVAHPRSIGKNDDGTYKEPTADEISGGAVWWQCADNILIFHRPSLPLNYLDTTCTLRSSKIKKQQLNGIPGMTTLQFDLSTGRYYEDGYNPLNDFVL